MHELTLANNLVELASDYAQRHGAQCISSVTVRLGVLCGISRSLYFCFEPAARGTRCEGAVLTIIESPLSVYCASCNDSKMPRALYNLRCPDCGRPTPKVLTGREMELVSIEIKGEPRAHMTDAAATSPIEHELTDETLGTRL
jgi:hydrogenase nickel incorporation protein HypA/HybF